MNPKTKRVQALSEKAEARRILDEQAAGRLRVGGVWRVCRTADDVTATGFPVRPTVA